MNDQCNVCGQTKVADYPECHIVENDFPQILEVENAGAKRALLAAFQTAHQLRCQFMGWMIQTKQATPDGEKNGFYQLPEHINMRPEPMMQLEDEIISYAKAIPANVERYDTSKCLAKLCADYVSRVHAFFTAQHASLIPERETITL